MSDREILARVASGLGTFDAAAWDACAGSDNPFLSHAFLSALEESGSAVARTGWQPAPLAIDGADGRPAALAPAYLKSHSQGEYVFDHAWADAYGRAGGRYYPKLQIAVPFTPGAGPSPACARSDACSGADRRRRAVVANNRLSFGARHLHRAIGSRAVRTSGLADPHG
jgi:predicted N-acyltransferase